MWSKTEQIERKRKRQRQTLFLDDAPLWMESFMAKVDPP
jgi:hypothetical protein